jgi:hypothetical protein
MKHSAQEAQTCLPFNWKHDEQRGILRLLYRRLDIYSEKLLEWIHNCGGNVVAPYSTLAEKINCSYSKARNTATALCEAGVLVKEANTQWGQKPNRYVINWAGVQNMLHAPTAPASTEHPPASTEHPPASTEHPPASTEHPPASTEQAYKELSLKELSKSSVRTHTPAIEDDREFESWYVHYPRKVGKQAARKAFAGAWRLIQARDPPANTLAWLIEITKHFAGTNTGRAGRYCPHPATWLNQARYDDDPKEWQIGSSTGPPKTGASYVFDQNSPDPRRF